MEQNLDVADPWLSRCHDECPVPCCDMSQISVMTAGSWTTCYIFCYITISYTQQHNMSEAHLTHYVYSLNNFKHSTPIHHAWSLRLTGIQRNIVIGRKQWKLWHGEKSMNASGQKSYRVRAVTATPHTTFLLEPPRRDIGDESSKYQNFITYSKLLFSATKTLFCLYARSQYSFC